MDQRKFEKLIDLIINENEEQARSLFHDIVVEKSREIYENMMMSDMDEGDASGQSMDLLDEISAEEMNEEDDMGDEDMGDDIEDFSDEEVIDIDSDDTDEDEMDNLEDTVIRIEDKLDQLMAEFEDLMDQESGEEEEEEGEEEEMMGDEEEEEGEEEEEEGEEMMEAIQLKQVKGLYGSRIGGDDGSQTRSTYAANSGQRGMASRPVKFSGDNEAVPTGPKAPSNYGSKGETQVKGAGQFKNSPAQDNFSEKGVPAPKAVNTQSQGVNDKSPVAESRRTTKRRI